MTFSLLGEIQVIVKAINLVLDHAVMPESQLTLNGRGIAHKDETPSKTTTRTLFNQSRRFTRTGDDP